MIVETGWLDDMRCGCGSAEIALIAPGDSEGAEAHATCMTCAVARGWLTQQAGGEEPCGRSTG